MSAHLPPHPWDDERHRAAIHTAFDRWMLCHAAGNRHQAAQYFRALERLTREASRRRETLAWIPAALFDVADLTAGGVQ